MQRLRRDIQEKQEALESMKRELENYTKVQLLFEQGGDTHDPGQVQTAPLCFSLRRCIICAYWCARPDH